MAQVQFVFSFRMPKYVELMTGVFVRMLRSFRVLVLSLLVAAVPMAGYAMSLEKEIELGRQEHKKIIAAHGVYKDAVLQDYINKVGQRVAAVSSRPEIEYTFTILNDDMINAFALPGGFIYVTRGMLTHMNSESELAAVLGHEIAHVTEKHAIRRQNKGKRDQFITSVVAVLTRQYAVQELGGILGGVLLTGYSREFELEADAVGARYMAQAGYSPDAMLKTIEILKNKDRIEIEQARIENREPRVYHGFLSTHPDHDTRYKEAIAESNKLVIDYDEFIRTDEFLQKLNGMSYGPARQAGVVRQNRFFHPRLGITLSFPDGWRQQAAPRGITFVSTQADAAFYLGTDRLYQGATPEKFAKERMGFKVREGGRDVTIGGYPAYLGIADRAESPFGPRPVRFAVIFDERRRLAYILTGAGKHDLSKIANDREFISTIFSFGRMDRDDFQVAKPPRVQIVRAEEGTTMEALAASSPLTNYALDKLRVINGLYPSGQPEPGQLIKVID